MNEGAHIGVFYSKGRTYLEVLRQVRSSAPTARLTAVVPAEYPLTPEERACVDDVAATELTRYSWRDPGPLLRLAGQLRRARFDAFVILFDSPRLRILSALAGARQRFYCRMDGELVPIRSSVPGTIADTILRSAWGRITYARIWLIVRCLRVRPR